VHGSIRHNSFHDMFYDITARVDSKPMELLATDYNDNQQFYGRAMGTGLMTLTGPQYDMQMQITARASETDSSYITLPPARYRESGTAAFMVERKYGREMTAEDLRGAPTNITYDVDLTANPLVNVEVILDELTGDVIRGRGNGNLRMRGGTAEPLSLRGRYDIDEGYYLFTFQSFFKKPFVLRPNTTNYIEWTGDPYGATIHFDAVYKAEGVSFAPLVSSLALENTGNLSRYRGDVNVIAKMTGELFHPVFNFELEFPGNLYNSIGPETGFRLQQGVQQIQSNQNEINKQVTYLIVFNSFAPYESSQTSFRQIRNEFAYSTISGLIFNEVNRRLNQLLSGILRNNRFTVNFTGSLYNRNLVDQNPTSFGINQSNLNISVGKSLFKERVLITLGGTFDVPIGLEANIQQNIQLYPDVTVEFLINKTGTVRATIFYRQTPDLLTGTPQTGTLRSQRAGANIAYRKEISSLSETLFGRKKGKHKKQLSATDTTNTGQ
ncbi:MAG: translocation/assembly module TamB domain-containing protein, partial [Chitinophagaceae bacterium]|nr:translocation/assembly module TamB domain-containing protein [Chitinophagaceae bacterium]